MDDDAAPRPGHVPLAGHGPLAGPRHDGLAALGVLTGVAACAAVLGQALSAGADMVAMQLTGSASGPVLPHVLAALVGLVLAAVSVVCAARISARDGAWPSALAATGVGLGVLSALLVVVSAAQWSMGMEIADTTLVSGTTSAGQGVSLLTALVLAAGAVPCLVVGSRRRAALGERRTRV